MIYSEKENRQATIQGYLIEHPSASLRELGELLGVSRQRVHVLLQRMNLQTARIKTRKKLTDRQIDILKYVVKGYTDRKIAEHLGCSAQSIRNQLHVIYAKLKVHDRKSAVKLAIKQGLLSKSAANFE